MNRTTVRRAMTAATLATALLGGLAAPAVADVSGDTAPSSVKIARTGGLYGDGAVILANIEVKCPAASGFGYLAVRVSQVAEWGTTTGEWGMELRCTGVVQTESVPVPGWSPFTTGEAFVTAELQMCDFECTSLEAVRTVNVVDGTQEVRAFRSHDLKYKLPNTGDIQAGGAGAVVLVPYTCTPGMYGAFEAMLAQSSGDGFVNFSGDYAELTCTASNRTGVLAFHASGGVWTGGPAFLLVTGHLCPDDEGGECALGTTYRSTKLA